MNGKRRVLSETTAAQHAAGELIRPHRPYQGPHMADGDHDDTQLAILTVLPPETTDDPDRRIQGVTTDRFTLLECARSADTTVALGERVPINIDAQDATPRQLTYETLSHDAQERLESTIEAIITRNEQRFINYYNDAQPISLRRHQLDLLPGIGQHRREAILRQRDRQPFEDFDDLDTRVDGLSTPHTPLAKRVLTELQDDDVTYTFFVE